jgi:methionyl-tRNA synthetase
MTEVAYICYILIKLLQPFMPKKIDKLLKNITFDVSNKEYNIFTCSEINGSFKIVNENYTLPFKQLDKKTVLTLLSQINVYYVQEKENKVDKKKLKNKI